MKKSTPDSSTPRNTDTGSDSAEINESSERVRKSRRKLIQILATGGVVTSAKLIPGSWTKPVVETVTLPAHAQTTEEDRGPGTCRLGINLADRLAERNQNSDDLSSSIADRVKELGHDLLDSFVGEAWADTTICEQFTGCFWIEFKCNSNKGRLCFFVYDETPDQDGAPEDEDSGVPVEEICVEFDDSGETSYEGVEFKIVIFDRHRAELTVKNCCSGEQTFPLSERFSCSKEDFASGDFALGLICEDDT